MKKRIANQSIVVLTLIVCFGLFQAWKESKNPFALFSGTKNGIEKPKNMSVKSVKYNTKDNYMTGRTFNQ